MAIATKEMEVGYEVPPVVKPVTLEKMRQYSGWPVKSFHTDDEAAQKLGFPRAVAEGMMPYGYAEVMLVDFFGEQWLEEGGDLSLSFIAPVFSGDTITVKGGIREKVAESSGVRLLLDVWCEREDGQKVVVGTASGLVH